MDQPTGLSGYLRARRAIVRPADVGFAAGPRRRVAGLRREELAALAGISADYLVRLEQGRDRHPSAQVLDALARALQLDGPSTSYLHQLAQPRRTPPARSAGDDVAAGLQDLLVTLDGRVSAFVQGPFMDVLAANELAVALSPSFAAGSNVVWSAFLDPSVRQLYPDWEIVVREAVAGLRASAEPYADDPHLADLVAELSASSALFGDLWARHDVLPKVAGSRSLHHPVLGPLELRHEKLLIPGTRGQILVLHHAEPGSAGAKALASLVAGAGVQD